MTGLVDGTMFQYLSTAKTWVTMELPATLGAGEPVKPSPDGVGLSPGAWVSPLGMTKSPSNAVGFTVMPPWKPLTDGSRVSSTRKSRAPDLRKRTAVVKVWMPASAGVKV